MTLATLPTDSDIALAHPDLPGLAVLLDPERLDRLTEQFGPGAFTLDRLRLKPGASVTAILRPVGGLGPRLLVRGLGPELWATKRDKDLGRARRLGLVAAEVASDRLLVVPAATDRSLAPLARLNPDTGALGVLKRHGPDGHRRRIKGRFRSLSHNPARRWVGLGETEAGERVVVRLHADRPGEVLPWHPGHPWRPGDPAPHTQRSFSELLPLSPLRADLRVGLRAGSLVRATASRRARFTERVGAAARGLRMLSPEWGDRADQVARSIRDPLGRVPLAPAHGDLTPDQVVVDGDTVHVLDWDEAGLWPLGWDSATWEVGLLLERWTDRGTSTGGLPTRPESPRVQTDDSVIVTAIPTAEVRAAAAIMRCPEPFRRRHSHWAERTEALLRHAEEALS